MPSILTQRHILKLLSFIVVAGVSATGLFWYVNNYVYRSSAAYPEIQAQLTVPQVVRPLEEFNLNLRLSGQQITGTELYIAFPGDVLQYYKEYQQGSGITQIPDGYFSTPIVEEVITINEDIKILHVTLVALGNENLSSIQLGFKFGPRALGEAEFILVTQSDPAFPNYVSTIVGADANGQATYFDFTPRNPNVVFEILGLAGTPTPFVTPDGITPTPFTTTNPTDRPTPTRVAPTLVSQNTPTPIPTRPVTPTPTTSNDPVPTGITPTVSSTDIALDLSVKFQGITAQTREGNRTLNAAVKLLTADGKPYMAPVVFTSQAGGIWSGRALFSANTGIAAGSGYTVYIKGAKHIQKEICTLNPTEQNAGSYKCVGAPSITLQRGTNRLNFSNIVLLAGDLPEQDGIVDSRDIVSVRSNLGNNTSTITARADLNLDGIVDSQDYTMVLAALGFKFDEE